MKTYALEISVDKTLVLFMVQLTAEDWNSIIINKEIAEENGLFLLLDVAIEGDNIGTVNIDAPTKDKEKEQID